MPDRQQRRRKIPIEREGEKRNFWGITRLHFLQKEKRRMLFLFPPSRARVTKAGFSLSVAARVAGWSV